MNIKKIVTTSAASALLLSSVAIPAFAAPFANGGFETGIAPGSFTPLFGGDNTSINGWTVGGNSVDYIGTYWTPAEGAKSIDLSGNDEGSISREFDTVVGKTYKVTFSLSGNPAGGPNEKTLNVIATGGVLTPFSYNTLTNGNSQLDMKWETKEYQFVAESVLSTVTFTSTTDGVYGPALDNVIVEEMDTTPEIEVPEQCNEEVEYNVIEGTDGSDVLTGTSGPDLILAKGGSDVVNGNNGNDCIVGGDGSDLLHGNNGHDVVLGGDGSDSINGHNGNDDLYGQDGSDSVKGGSGNDDLWGGQGSDSLKGEAGNDKADGGTEIDACSAETEDASCEA